MSKPGEHSRQAANEPEARTSVDHARPGDSDVAIEDDAEPSGLPIAVSDGEIATPTRRRRRITRPRGLPPLTGIATPEAAGSDGQPRHLNPVDEFLAAPPTPRPDFVETPPLDAEQTLDGAVPRAGGAIENLAAAATMRRDARGGGEGDDDTLVDSLLEQAASEIASLDAPSPTADTRESVDNREALKRSSPPSEPFSSVDPSSQPLVSLDVQMAPPEPPPFHADAHELPVTLDVADVGDLTEVAEIDQPVAVAPETADFELSPLAQTLANMAEALQADLGVVEDIEEIVDAPLTAAPTAAPGKSRPPPVPVVAIPEALAERPRRPKRAKPWYEEVFDEDYLRTLPFMTPEQTLREVDFIESSLKVAPGGAVLDIGCGYGRHAIELVQRGLNVTGIDLSLPLLIRAADESQRRSVSVNFVHTDMRELVFDREFDGAYCVLSSFGYFDEETNLQVAERVARALKPGGRLLIDVVNRDYVVSDLPTRLWWEGDGCVVLEEVEFNFNTSRVLSRRSVVFEDGRQLEQEISVRAYSLHELGRLIRQAGFRVLEVSGSYPTRGSFFGATSRHIILLAERRSE